MDDFVRCTRCHFGLSPDRWMVIVPSMLYLVMQMCQKSGMVAGAVKG